MPLNARVITKRIISMGIEKFEKKVRINMNFLFETIYEITDFDMNKTVFVNQVHDIVLIYDILGKPLQNDFHVLKCNI